MLTADQESEEEDDEDIYFDDEDFEGKMVPSVWLTRCYPINKQWFSSIRFVCLIQMMKKIRLFDTDDEEDMLEHYLAEKSDASAPIARA